MSPIEKLTAVLCDPTGKCCITGSDADRAIVDEALAALRATPATATEPVAMEASIRKVGDYEWRQLSMWDFAQKNAIELLAPIGNHVFRYELRHVTEINGNSWKTEAVTSFDELPVSIFASHAGTLRHKITKVETAIVECWLCRDHPGGSQQTTWSEAQAEKWAADGYEVIAMGEIGKFQTKE